MIKTIKQYINDLRDLQVQLRREAQFAVGDDLIEIRHRQMEVALELRELGA